jgi:hypothetical protein
MQSGSMLGQVAAKLKKGRGLEAVEHHDGALLKYSENAKFSIQYTNLCFMGSEQL